MNTQTQFARGGESLELRGEAPADLVRALDALAGDESFMALAEANLASKNS